MASFREILDNIKSRAAAQQGAANKRTKLSSEKAKNAERRAESLFKAAAPPSFLGVDFKDIGARVERKAKSESKDFDERTMLIARANFDETGNVAGAGAAAGTVRAPGLQAKEGVRAKGAFGTQNLARAAANPIPGATAKPRFGPTTGLRAAAGSPKPGLASPFTINTGRLGQMLGAPGTGTGTSAAGSAARFGKLKGAGRVGGKLLAPLDIALTGFGAVKGVRETEGGKGDKFLGGLARASQAASFGLSSGLTEQAGLTSGAFDPNKPGAVFAGETGGNAIARMQANTKRNLEQATGIDELSSTVQQSMQSYIDFGLTPGEAEAQINFDLDRLKAEDPSISENLGTSFDRIRAGRKQQMSPEAVAATQAAIDSGVQPGVALEQRLLHQQDKRDIMAANKEKKAAESGSFDPRRFDITSPEDVDRMATQAFEDAKQFTAPAQDFTKQGDAVIEEGLGALQDTGQTQDFRDASAASLGDLDKQTQAAQKKSARQAEADAAFAETELGVSVESSAGAGAARAGGEASSDFFQADSKARANQHANNLEQLDKAMAGEFESNVRLAVLNGNMESQVAYESALTERAYSIYKDTLDFERKEISDARKAREESIAKKLELSETTRAKGDVAYRNAFGAEVTEVLDVNGKVVGTMSIPSDDLTEDEQAALDAKIVAMGGVSTRISDKKGAAEPPGDWMLGLAALTSGEDPLTQKEAFSYLWNVRGRKDIGDDLEAIGVAYDPETGRFYTAGQNNDIVELDAQTVFDSEARRHVNDIFSGSGFDAINNLRKAI